MTWSLIAGCGWVILASIVALLPMRHQYKPGFVLLIAAPLIIIWVAYDHGWWFIPFGLFAFISMFRNPLMYFYRRARGERPDIPK